MRFLLGLLVATVLAGSAGLVIADVARGPQIAASPTMAIPGDDVLGARWETVEGTWRGTWVRRPNTNVYDGTWTSNLNPSFRGTLSVRIIGDELVVDRHDRDSNNSCRYTARLDSIPASWRREALVIAGTGSCSNTNHTWVTPWAARIVR